VEKEAQISMKSETGTDPLAPAQRGTIDGNKTNDDGYLVGARKFYSRYKANHDTATTSRNLSAPAGSPKSIGATAMIIGHGNEGVINTSGGQTWPSGNPDHSIALTPDLNFESTWAPLMKSLNGRIGQLVLLACDTGAGQPGADLLFELARCVNCPVLAPTGKVDFAHAKPSLEAGSKWQSAQPQHPKPSPIPPPTPPEVSWQALMLLSSTGNETTIPRSAVRLVTYRPIAARGKQRQSEDMVFRGDDRSRIITSVRFDEPMKSSSIGGIVTAELTLEFDQAAASTSRQFRVYNDRFLLDLEAENVYYRATSRFREELNKIV
jgi:hypothetical protein